MTQGGQKILRSEYPLRLVQKNAIGRLLRTSLEIAAQTNNILTVVGSQLFSEHYFQNFFQNLLTLRQARPEYFNPSKGSKYIGSDWQNRSCSILLFILV